MKAHSKPQPSVEALIDRLADEAKLLRAVIAIMDGRSSQARTYRRMEKVISDALMFIAGVQANRERAQKRGRRG